jgi:rod shape-determining protein MreC
MRNLFLFIRRYYPFFLFILLEIAAFILIGQSNTYHHSTFVNSSNQVTGRTYEIKSNISEYFQLKQQNDKLEAENAELRKWLSNIENDTFKIQWDTLDREVYTYTPVRVINHSTTRRYNYFTINKGSNHGIKADLGVIDTKGIVGIITNVSPNFSVGQSLLNINRRTSVKHKNSNAIGRMRWNGNRLTEFIIEDITKTARVEVGDTIITSGYSTYYPEQIPVAIVKEAVLKEGSDFYEIKATLTNDILSIDRVYIVNHSHKIEIDSLEIEAIEE